MEKTSILGLLRFSMVLKSDRGFPSLVGTAYEDRCDLIFAADRMTQRLAALEHVLFASLRVQTDPEFRLAILITGNMPPRFRTQLTELVAQMPQAFVVTVPPARLLRFGCVQACAQAIAPDAKRWATFRIDDDDALSLTYIERIRKHLGQINVPTALSFDAGLELACGHHGTAVMQRDTRPFSGAGLALLCGAGFDAASFPSVYQLGPHRRVADHVATRIDSDGPAFLRVLHDTNVSSAGLRRGVPVLPMAERDAEMAKWFPSVSVSTLARIWA